MEKLKLNDISFSYDGRRPIFAHLNYAFETGKVYGIVGRSGAGKTTLLSLLSGLAKPTAGQILFDGKDIGKMDKYTYRSKCVGIIFQSFNLLPHLTAAENVELSMDIAGMGGKDKRQRTLDLLDKVDLDEEVANRRILKLSGGEQQRVAIARALSFHPDIILADEPTGNLDMDTQDEVFDIFRRLAHEEDKCVILVTHSPEIASKVDSVLQLAPLKKGKERNAPSRIPKTRETNET